METHGLQIRVLVAATALCGTLVAPAMARSTRGATGLPPGIALTMHLEAGVHIVGPVGDTLRLVWRPAPDIPPGSLTTSVPLYPGAVPTTMQYYPPGFTVYMSPYLKSAWVEELISAPVGMALTWYRGECSSIGLLEEEEVSGGGVRSPQTTELYFVSKPDPDLRFGFYSDIGFSSFLLGISLQPAGAADQSVVYYWAESVAPPTAK